MSSQIPTPYFQAHLYPTLRRVEGNQAPRFLLQTSWEVRRSDGLGVVGEPRLFDSLLVLEDLFVSVLPYTFHQDLGISVARLSGTAQPWRGIACDLGVANLWLLHAGQHTTLWLRLLVRLPQTAAKPDPHYPLIGTQFFRQYEPRLTLDYGQFTWGLTPNFVDPVGWMERA